MANANTQDNPRCRVSTRTARTFEKRRFVHVDSASHTPGHVEGAVYLIGLAAFHVDPLVILPHPNGQPLRRSDRRKADKPILVVRAALLATPLHVGRNLCRDPADAQELVPVMRGGFFRHADAVETAADFT